MKVLSWHKIEHIETSDLAEGVILEITVADKKICLLKRNNEILAFAAICPHAGVPLCKGWLDPLGRIVCPEHKFRFDPVSGRNTSGEGYKLFTYQVQVTEGQIFIGFMKS